MLTEANSIKISMHIKSTLNGNDIPTSDLVVDRQYFSGNECKAKM